MIILTLLSVFTLITKQQDDLLLSLISVKTEPKTGAKSWTDELWFRWISVKTVGSKTYIQGRIRSVLLFASSETCVCLLARLYLVLWSDVVLVWSDRDLQIKVDWRQQRIQSLERQHLLLPAVLVKLLLALCIRGKISQSSIFQYFPSPLLHVDWTIY